MISSTVADLREERKAVDDVIREFEYERFRSEAMGSIADSSERVCIGMAQKCDLMILLIGERYGYVDPAWGVSVTQKEFETAREQDKHKILVFVKSVADGKMESRAIEFMRQATDFRDGYFRAAFRDVQELREQVRGAIRKWIVGRIESGHLSPENVFQLADPKSTIRSVIQFLALLTMCLALLEVASLAGVPKYIAPSLSDLVAAITGYGSLIIHGLVSALNRGLPELFAGLTIGISLAAASMRCNRKWADVLGPVVIVLFLFLCGLAFFFGFIFLGFGLLWRLLPATFAAVAASVRIINEERKKRAEMQDPRSKAFVKRVLINALLSPSVPLLLFVTIGINVAQDFLFSGDRTTIAGLYFRSQQMVNTPLSYALVITFSTVIIGTYLMARLLQGFCGGQLIVAPQMGIGEGNAGRPPDSDA